MPAAWIAAGAGVIGAYESTQNSGGGGGSAKGPTYTPTDISGADQGWQNAFNTTGQIAGNAYGTSMPAYQQSFQNQQNINYQPYQQNQNQVGQEYGSLANIANGQMGMYGQQAGLAAQQQGNLYSGANQIMSQAFDPNNAQYNQSQQQLSDQVNAGQAQRGLGNSAIGGQEYGNAMSNFDIGWNTQKLQNEQIGLQGASQASNAGGSQGQLVGANLVGALNAGQQGAGYQQQAGQIPLQAQQMIAGMPAQNAAAYQNNLSSLEGMYGNQMSAAIPYMNNGQGSQQWNADYNTNQNAANMQLLTQGAQGLANQYNQPGSWLNNTFGNNGSQNANQVNSTYGNTTNAYGDNINPNVNYGGSQYAQPSAQPVDPGVA